MLDSALPIAATLLPGSEIQMIWSVLIAAILGAILGVERSMAGKSAGMRTYAMVSLGSCLFVTVGIIASHMFSEFAGINPLQLTASVIVGVGFIGSGLAALKRDGHVELTTASGIWVVAGVGIACGFGLYLLAFVVTVIAATVLTLVWRIENGIISKYARSEKLKK